MKFLFIILIVLSASGSFAMSNCGKSLMASSHRALNDRAWLPIRELYFNYKKDLTPDNVSEDQVVLREKLEDINKKIQSIISMLNSMSKHSEKWMDGVKWMDNTPKGLQKVKETMDYHVAQNVKLFEVLKENNLSFMKLNKGTFEQVYDFLQEQSFVIMEIDEAMMHAHYKTK